ncbi:MAG: hypothetical protein ACRBBZ_03370 [Nitrosopumilus sp.]
MVILDQKMPFMTGLAIAVIEKPFSLNVLDYMISNSEVFNKLEKININQQGRNINEKC